MKIATIKQQPNEKRKYSIDYTDALDPGDEVESVLVTSVEPLGLTVSALAASASIVTLVVQSGVDGANYKVTIQVTTTGENEIIEDELYVKVREV